MTINVKIDLGYEFDVKASAADVFAVLSDVPTSASFFPKVDKLVDLGGNSYRWEMEKIGVASVNLQTIYASKYVSNKAKGTVMWSPIKSEGNAAMWRRTELQGIQQEAELALRLFRIDAQQFKDHRLHVGAMDTH